MSLRLSQSFQGKCVYQSTEKNEMGTVLIERLLKYHVSIKPVFLVQIKQRNCPDPGWIHVQESLNCCHHEIILNTTTVPRRSQYWKSFLQNMGYLKRSNPTMDPSLQVTSLQSSQRTRALSTVHLHQGTPGAMVKQNLQSGLLKDCLPVPNALDRIHISLC